MENQGGYTINKDIHIKYLHNFDGYNVTRFVSSLKEKPATWQNELDQLVKDIDDKVSVDFSDDRNKIIYQGVETIIDKLCELLPCIDSLYTGIKHRLAGSVSAGVKVGLPHEADYVLEIQEPKIKRGIDHSLRLYKAVSSILRKSRSQIFEDMPFWIVHGTERHTRIPGICLILECCREGLQKDSVAVTVDLVLAHKVRSGQTRGFTKFTKNAEMYLRNNIEHFVANGDVYQLVNQKVWDAGIIENKIIKDLDPGKKRGFRVAKYLLQNLFSTNEPAFGGTLSRDLSLKLYGYKPWIKSYRLRQCFLHLLIQTRGTDVETRLSDGILVLCLLDMLRFQYSSNCHDFIESIMCGKRPHISVPSFHQQRDDRVAAMLAEKLQRFTTAGPYSCLDSYKLLNSDNNELSPESDRLLLSRSH